MPASDGSRRSAGPTPLVAARGPLLRLVASGEVLLSGFAKVLGWSERWSIGGMEMNFESGEQGLGCLLEACQVVPPAMARQLVFEVAPQTLDQVELRRV